jgi:hypothetical protein
MQVYNRSTTIKGALKVSDSFLVNYLKFKRSSSATSQLSNLMPELYKLLSSGSDLGGEVLYLLCSLPDNFPILKHVIKDLGGIAKLHRQHWLHVCRVTQFSNECPVELEEINSVNGYLYISGAPERVRYMAQSTLDGLLRGNGIVKCPETRKRILWFIPLACLSEDVLNSLVVGDADGQANVQEDHA